MVPSEGIAHNNFVRFYEDLQRHIEEEPSWFSSHEREVKEQFQKIGEADGDSAVMRALDELERICSDEEGTYQMATAENLNMWLQWVHEQSGA